MSGLDIRNTSKQIYAQVDQLFSEKRKQEFFKRKEALTMELYVLPNGTIKEIDFHVAKDRLMTLPEIEELDEAIRKNVKVPVTQSELYKGLPFIVFLPEPIRFAKLYP
jgi:SpoVK/Ycf46/Vps4 family AAA+-type ATPase